MHMYLTRKYFLERNVDHKIYTINTCSMMWYKFEYCLETTFHCFGTPITRVDANITLLIYKPFLKWNATLIDTINDLLKLQISL